MRQTPTIRSCSHPTSNVAYIGLMQVLCEYFNRPHVSVWKENAQLTGTQATGLVTPPPPSHGPIDETTGPPNKKRSIRASDHVNRQYDTDADDAGFSRRATGIFDGKVSPSFKGAGAVGGPARGKGEGTPQVGEGEGGRQRPRSRYGVVRVRSKTRYVPRASQGGKGPGAVAPPAEANGKPVVSPALVPFFAYILLYHTRCSQLLATPAHGVGG
jgi:hypothetical protein